MKRTFIPGYGKKGIGFITNPKKASYNYIYHRTTKSIFDTPKKHTANTDTVVKDSVYEVIDKDKIRIGTEYYSPSTLQCFAIFFIGMAFIIIPLSFIIMPFGIFTLIISLYSLYNAYNYLSLANKAKNMK